MNYISCVLLYCIAWINSQNYGNTEKIVANPEIQSSITNNVATLFSPDSRNELQSTTSERIDGNQSSSKKEVDESETSKQLLFETLNPENPLVNRALPYHYERSYHYSYPPFSTQTSRVFYDSYINPAIPGNPQIYQSEYAYAPPSTITLDNKSNVHVDSKTNIANSTATNDQNQSFDTLNPTTFPLNGISNSEPHLSTDRYSTLDFERFFFNPQTIHKRPYFALSALDTYESHRPLISENYPSFNTYRDFMSQNIKSSNLPFSRGVTSTTSLQGYHSPSLNLPARDIEELFKDNIAKGYSSRKPYLRLYTVPSPYYHPSQSPTGFHSYLSTGLPSPTGVLPQTLESSASIKTEDTKTTENQENLLNDHKNATISKVIPK